MKNTKTKSTRVNNMKQSKTRSTRVNSMKHAKAKLFLSGETETKAQRQKV